MVIEGTAAGSFGIAQSRRCHRPYWHPKAGNHATNKGKTPMANIRSSGRDHRRTAVRRTLTMVAVAGALAVALAACGKDSTPTTTASGQSATTLATTVTTLAPVVTTTPPKPTVATASNALGTILVDPASGKTLYIRDSDPAGTSSCTGSCAATWPALVLPTGVTAPVAPTGITGLTAAARPDDATKMQVLSNGKPLYTYAGDATAGDTKGDGVGGVWHVAKAA
jgi:predicted lipoprotein with Yx(FWY)xxD motif